MRLQQKTALQKTALLVRAGMMEPPKWYAATKQVRRDGGRERQRQREMYGDEEMLV